MYSKFILLSRAAPWRKRLDVCLPQLGSHIRVPVTPCGFRGDETESGKIFLEIFPVFSCHKFHSTISPHSSHTFNIIRPCDGALGISPLDPALCQTVVENIQSEREISAIIVTDDYLCYKEPKSLNVFLILIFNKLFKFKTSDEWQH